MVTPKSQDECVIGVRIEQQMSEIRNRLVRVELTQDNINERIWQELSNMNKEIGAMRGEFTREMSAVRDEFSKQISNSTPPWVTVGFSILMGVVGALGGFIAKAFG